MDSTRLATAEPIAKRDTLRLLRFDASHDTLKRPWFWQVERSDPPTSSHDEAPVN